MKLLIYSRSFAPDIGGVETIVRALAQGLEELRNPQGDHQFDVTVVTESRAQFEQPDVLFEVVRRPGIAGLYRLIRASDVVHLAGPALLPLFLAKIFRRRVVIEHHGYQSICPNGLLLHLPDRSVCPGHFMAGNYRECVRCQSHELSTLGAIRSLLLMFPRRFLSRSADHNIAITNHVRQRVALPHSSVVYYGISQSDADKCPASVQPPSKISFGYLGRFVPEKGIPVLLEATRQLAGKGFSFDVQLIGDGPERPRIEETITRMNLQNFVRLRGFLTGPALADALHRIHAVIVPSTWEEAAGLAAMEPMMRGKAIIASDIGGLGEVVADSGLKFPPGDAEALAGCMAQVLREPARIPRWGELARSRAQELFALQRMIAEHAEIYRESLKPRR